MEFTTGSYPSSIPFHKKVAVLAPHATSLSLVPEPPLVLMHRSQLKRALRPSENEDCSVVKELMPSFCRFFKIRGIQITGGFSCHEHTVYKTQGSSLCSLFMRIQHAVSRTSLVQMQSEKVENTK